MKSVSGKKVKYDLVKLANDEQSVKSIPKQMSKKVDNLSVKSGTAC